MSLIIEMKLDVKILINQLENSTTFERSDTNLRGSTHGQVLEKSR